MRMQYKLTHADSELDVQTRILLRSDPHTPKVKVWGLLQKKFSLAISFL